MAAIRGLLAKEPSSSMWGQDREIFPGLVNHSQHVCSLPAPRAIHVSRQQCLSLPVSHKGDPHPTTSIQSVGHCFLRRPLNVVGVTLELLRDDCVAERQRAALTPHPSVQRAGLSWKQTNKQKCSIKLCQEPSWGPRTHWPHLQCESQKEKSK